ncbi:predicted protein [Methanosarcina acetivorans C2A]|uniref:Uncharacterized protein n=1 Tax=Methanosarcina acetivorans (strain ATCC 35395 / DSM 2834 / JCM 12185 / C2A) TaxID=188937 RepID=Q8TTF9_METAC|nr:predicted protein [Methanosarcina acetivorans C2A]
MKFITESAFSLLSACPEFTSFYSLCVNEVGFEIGFQAVLNLLHFTAYASMKFITGSDYYSVLNFLHFTA